MKDKKKLKMLREKIKTYFSLRFVDEFYDIPQIR